MPPQKGGLFCAQTYQITILPCRGVGKRQRPGGFALVTLATPPHGFFNC